jgi:hypothetical protein
MTDSLMILIAGPYRSGTGDDPQKMAENVAAMTRLALPLFRAGHLPMVGEWLALPLVEEAGSRRVGDAAFDEIFHPSAIRLLARCDAVLRVGGPSAGADEMVRIAGTRPAGVSQSGGRSRRCQLSRRASQSGCRFQPRKPAKPSMEPNPANPIATTRSQRFRVSAVTPNSAMPTESSASDMSN